jgi:hypothetical protein
VICSGYNPEVGFNLCCIAHSGNYLLFGGTQNLCLEIKRHIGNFIEK